MKKESFKNLKLLKNSMHLEQALRLKKGTKLKADSGLIRDKIEILKRGNIYTLLADAEPIYKNGKLRNAEISVIGDRGEKVKLTYEDYFSFIIVK